MFGCTAILEPLEEIAEGIQELQQRKGQCDHSQGTKQNSDSFQRASAG